MKVFITGNQGRHTRAAEPGQLHLRPDGLRQPAHRRRAGRRGRRLGHADRVHPDGRAWVDGVAQGYLTMGRLEIPRCDNDPDQLDHGTLHAAPGRRQMSTAAAPADGQPVRLLHRADPRDTRGDHQPPGAVARSPTASGRYATFKASMLARCPRPTRRSRARRAAHPRHRRLLHRAARRLGGGAGHPDLLPGALRQRSLPAHRRRPALGHRTAAPGRLRAVARRGRLGRPGLHAASAPGAPGQRS